MMKNVACVPSAASTSSRSGVVDGFGPSSNVRYTVGLPVGGIDHTARSPAIQSITNGAGHVCASAVTAILMARKMNMFLDTASQRQQFLVQARSASASFDQRAFESVHRHAECDDPSNH